MLLRHIAQIRFNGDIPSFDFVIGEREHAANQFVHIQRHHLRRSLLDERSNPADYCAGTTRIANDP
jgi:hypothetical protein